MSDYLDRTFNYDGGCLRPTGEVSRQFVVGIDKQGITDFAGHMPMIYNSVEELAEDLLNRKDELRVWLEDKDLTLTITSLKVSS